MLGQENHQWGLVRRFLVRRRVQQGNRASADFPEWYILEKNSEKFLGSLKGGACSARGYGGGVELGGGR